MKQIKRDFYLNKLIQKDGNGLIKIITGVRRSDDNGITTMGAFYFLLNEDSLEF